MKTKRKSKKKHQRYIGKRFGLLTVVEYTGKRKARPNGQSYPVFKCLCDCGNEKLITSDYLYRGSTKSCGCLANKLKTGYKELSGSYIGDIRKGARYRGIEYDIDAKYAYEIWEKQNKKCKISGMDLKFSTTTYSYDGNASLDRIDSSKGYVRGNVQWVHKDINKMKMDLDEARFMELCKIIAKHNS